MRPPNVVRGGSGGSGSGGGGGGGGANPSSGPTLAALHRGGAPRQMMTLVLFTRKATQQCDIKPNQIYLRQISRTKHKERMEYVDRAQRQYETALTRALKIKTKKRHCNINLSLAILCSKQATVGE